MGRILAVDYGRRRIGFALSDPGGVLASPTGRAVVSSPQEAAAEVKKRLIESGADEIVFGIPFNMDGTLGEMGREVRAFAADFAAQGLRVHEWDERLTSIQAERALRGSGLGRRKKKEKTDAVAAQIILQSFLDSRRAKG